MSLKFHFETDSPQLAKLIRDTAEKALPSEAAKAINRTITFAAKEAADAISRETGVSRTLIKRRLKAIKRRRASPKNLKAWGFMGEVEFPVSKLTPKPKKTGAGVTYKTLPGQAQNPKAFYAKMPSGKKSAYFRKTSARTPVKEVTINITKQMRRNLKRVLDTSAPAFMEQVFQENMQKRVHRDIIRAGLRNR